MDGEDGPQKTSAAPVGVETVVMPAPSLDVLEIVEAYLRATGQDGLYQPKECACALGDLAPCGEIRADCIAGHQGPCDCGDHDFHIGPRSEA